MKLKISGFILAITILISGCNYFSLRNKNANVSLNDSIRAIDSLIQQSGTYYNSQNFNDSIFDSYLIDAFNIAERNNLLEQEAHIYLHLGKRHRNVSEFGKALYYYEKSLDLSNTIGNDSLNSFVKHEMAVVFRRIDDNAKALNLHFEVLEWAESAKDTLLILSSNNGIGNVYFSYNDLENAIFYFHKSLNILNKGHKNKLSKAINTNNIGEAWLDLGNADSAFYYLNQSYLINVEMDSKIGQAICKNGLGDVYTYLKDYKKAIAFYNESLKLNREIGNLIYVSRNLINLGNVYLKINNYTKAKNYLEEALSISKNIGSKSHVVETLQLLSDFYLQRKRPDLSVPYLRELVVYKDSITEEITRLNSTGMRALYHMEKQEREIVILKQKDQLSQLKLGRLRILIISGIVTIFGILILLAFILYQRKQKSNYLNQIELQHKSIRDSIQYAEKIQAAILPKTEILDGRFSDNFVLFRPRDVVSGDFYWFTEIGELSIIVTADCTGHGVPGALMSMLGVSYLNEIINTGGITEPNMVLNILREQIVKQLHQNGILGEAKDGLELSLFSINHSSMTLKFSGAYNPIYIIRNEELIQLKPDKMPIGYHPTKKASFTVQEIQIQKGDCIYSASDGYSDQFGGNNGSKFLIKKFKELLLSIHKKPMLEQKNILDNKLDNWRGEIEQIDDIVILGVKI